LKGEGILKKIITSLVITIGLVGMIASNNFALAHKESENFKVPNLNSFKVAKDFKKGNISLKTNDSERVDFKTTFKQLEHLAGKPVEKKLLSNDKYIKIEYSYNLNQFSNTDRFKVVFEGIAKDNSNYKKAKIGTIKLKYDKKYSLQLVEKYFGKSQKDYTIKEKNLWIKEYSKNVTIDYKKVRNNWFVNEVTLNDNTLKYPKEEYLPTYE